MYIFICSTEVEKEVTDDTASRSTDSDKTPGGATAKPRTSTVSDTHTDSATPSTSAKMTHQLQSKKGSLKILKANKDEKLQKFAKRRSSLPSSEELQRLPDNVETWKHTNKNQSSQSKSND